MMNTKAILVFDGYETLKKQYGKKVLITINIPVEGKKGTRGYQYLLTEDAILKPMPEKIEILDSRMKTAIGWNDCIDEILRGTE